jgi:AcrR family transcriptional regulator
MTPDSPATDAPSARDRILHTAHDLFYRDGVRATGIDRVIAESGVAKLTFYRHFPSKNDLIKAYLAHRHRLWMDWLTDALARHRMRGRGVAPLLVAVFKEWFESEGYRGCAFLNVVVELAGVLPEVADIAKRHKDEVAEAIVRLLPESDDRRSRALTIVVALDGAILRAQMENNAVPALDALNRILRALIKE